MTNLCWFAIPGDPHTLTGGYIYAQRVMEELPATGWTPRLLSLPAGFPDPSREDIAATQAAFAALPPKSVVVVDGLAFGALPSTLLKNCDVRFVALVHHPLALESNLDPAMVDHLRRTERSALGAAHAVVTTSIHTAQSLRNDYNVAPERLYIALPGTSRALRAQGGGATPLILTVATLTRRKGYDVLVQALSSLRDLPWKSVMIGSLEREQHTAAEIVDAIHASGLADRVILRGELAGEDLARAYAGADIFALASRHEGYGMAFAEALARGLPVVACAAGAVTDTVPNDCGILVPPDDAEAFAGALRRLLTAPTLRQKMADAAWAHGQRLPQWGDTAATFAAALQAVSWKL